MKRHQRRDRLIAILYARALLQQFRWTLVTLAALVVLGAMVYMFAPGTNAEPASFWSALYSAWMAMLAQPVRADTWYLKLLCGLYPLFGFVIVGEGIVRLALLITSREQGEREWMNVMASTYQDHVILCGIGHLGFRVVEQLVASKVPVVVLEKKPDARFFEQTKALGIPVLIRDMKEDQALIDAGVQRARVIIIATNDDMANIEVALDSRRMNPKIRILMRQYDQQIAAKISGALTIDAAFSASALSAPIVAAMAMEARVMATFVIAGVPHVTAEIKVDSSSTLAGKTVSYLERDYSLRVLARILQSGTCQSPPPSDAVVTSGDALVIHTAAAKLPALASDSKLTG